MGHFSSVNVWCRSSEGRYPLFPTPQPPLYEKRSQVQSERFTKIELERPSLVEGVPWGTWHTTALLGVVTVTQESDTELKNLWLLHWIIYALSLLQKRMRSTIKGSRSHEWEVCGTVQPPSPQPVRLSNLPHRSHGKLRISIRSFTHSE